MEIDRRTLVIGFAATTAAAMLPALPAQAILSGVRRFEFLDGPIFSRLTPPPRGCVPRSLTGFGSSTQTTGTRG
jgi:hypothetical protein